MLVFKIILLLVALSSATAKHSHFYRRDYTYFQEFDAFYKLHSDLEHVTWETAFMACEHEGAKLFYPKEEGEWAVVRNLTTPLAETLNTTDVIVGIHDEIGKGDFVTVEGAVTPNPITREVSTRAGQNCVIVDSEEETFRTEPCEADPLTRRIFLCKKVDEKPCKTIDLGYKYSEVAKKCYKVNTRRRSWQDAWRTCFMEGGQLVAPDTVAEVAALNDMISGSGRQTYYFCGFRRIQPGGDFYTVGGKRIEESGFPSWHTKRDEEFYSCGSFNTENNYLYIENKECDISLPFICELVDKV